MNILSYLYNPLIDTYTIISNIRLLIKFTNSIDELVTFVQNNNIGEIYVSHVIQKMILNNHKFEAEEVSSYSDFGTYEEWKKYTDKSLNVFLFQQIYL